MKRPAGCLRARTWCRNLAREVSRVLRHTVSVTAIQEGHVTSADRRAGRVGAGDRRALSQLPPRHNRPGLKAWLEAPTDGDPETEEERQAVQEAREELARGEVRTLAAGRRELGR
jgi:hypothetical protein